MPYVGAEEKSDPFIKMAYCGDWQRRGAGNNRTSVGWSKSIEYEFRDGGALIIELYDYDDVSSSEYIGSVVVEVTDSSPGQKEWRGYFFDVDKGKDAGTSDSTYAVVEYTIEE